MVSGISSTSPSSVQQAPAFTANDAKMLKDKSTELYESAMRAQWRREQQRERMVKWRLQKKARKTNMIEERRRLERKLQHHVLQARVASDMVTAQSPAEAYRQAIIESSCLMSENIALKEAIEENIKTRSKVAGQVQEFLNQILPGESPVPASKDDEGWHVHFPNGEPSFYFTPFTKKEYDNILNNNDILYAQRHPCTATVGKILGWTVDYAPLARNEAGTSFVAHARFTRRLKCNLDDSEKILPHLDKNLWPVLVTPRSWGRSQSGSAYCQTLQSFHENAHVMTCNVPGEVNLRYIVLAQHTRERRSDGKRVDKYIMTIADSEANARIREAEGPQEDVQWVLEGGTYMTVTEVDESTIDVVFDQWAGCLSELHGRELYIDWIRFPVGMEQFISPARLLCC